MRLGCHLGQSTTVHWASNSSFPRLLCSLFFLLENTFYCFPSSDVAWFMHVPFGHKCKIALRIERRFLGDITGTQPIHTIHSYCYDGSLKPCKVVAINTSWGKEFHRLIMHGVKYHLCLSVLNLTLICFSGGPLVLALWEGEKTLVSPLSTMPNFMSHNHIPS